MAVIVPIVSKFDDKGIKQAQSQFGKLGSSMKGLLATAGLAVGLAAVTNGLQEAAKAAVADTKSQALLAAQLKNTVSATDAQTAAVEQSISKMQLMAGVADDDIRPAFSSLLVATKDIGQATALTSLALDVAAGTGKDLGAVTMALGKAINGSSTSLVKLIPSIKGAKDPLGELQKQFAGMAETAANADPFQRMQIIFGDIQEQIGMQLLPALQEVSMWLASPAGQEEVAKLVDAFKELAKFVGGVILFLKDNYEMLLKVAGLAALIVAISTAFGLVTTAIKIATAAQVIFAAVSAATPFGMIALAIGAIGAAWYLAADGANTYATASADATDTGPSGGAPITPKGKDGGPLTLTEANKTFGKVKPKTTPDVAAAVDPLAALKKQIESLKTTTDTVKKTNTTVADASKKAAEARAKAIEDAKAIAQEAKQAFENMKKAVEDFNKSFSTTAAGFRELFMFKKPLGEFEAQAVDAFQSMKDAAEEAFDNGLITKTALDSLKAYADKESTLLVGIAKQRDVLAKKMSIAESVTAGVMGSLDINSMLSAQTKTVTKSVTSIVNGIALTTTQSFDEVVTGGLAASFKKLVDKTKTFAGNLVKLKQLGLNGNLFKQIVDGGADAGGATAEAIIAGGADAVKELNGLFTELTDAGAEIAKTSTPVLYDLGENMTNSFIDGLRSQDQVLIDTANSMAALFTEQFKSKLNMAIAPTVAATQNAAMSAQMSVDLSSRPDPKRSPQSYANWLSSIGGIDPVRSPDSYARAQANTYNVTINAGAITDQASLPTIVTNALVTATKQGLTGGLSRLLAV
jgi:hypothetical protein